MNKYTKNSHNAGIDLLRALAMIMVILLHFVGHGELLAHAQPGSMKFWILSFVQILAYCCVNLYGLTTGYVMWNKPFRLSRVTKLWVTTVFWSVMVSCVFFLLAPESRTISEMVSMFFPVLRGRYWFFTAYVVTMLLSPVLNLVIRSLSKGQYHLLLAVLFLLFGVIPVGSLGYDVMRISTGHHFSWMIVLYILGGYLRRFVREGAMAKKFWLLGYLCFALVHLLYQFVVTLIGLEGYKNLLLTYPSPLIVGEAICLFLYFRDLGAEISDNSTAGKVIQIAAPGVYSVYVIHVHPLVYWNTDIISLFRNWDNWNVLVTCGVMLALAMELFAVCVCLDTLRQWLFRGFSIDRTIGKLSDCIEQIIRNYLC